MHCVARFWVVVARCFSGFDIITLYSVLFVSLLLVALFNLLVPEKKRYLFWLFFFLFLILF